MFVEASAKQNINVEHGFVELTKKVIARQLSMTDNGTNEPTHSIGSTVKVDRRGAGGYKNRRATSLDGAEMKRTAKKNAACNC